MAKNFFGYPDCGNMIKYSPMVESGNAISLGNSATDVTTTGTYGEYSSVVYTSWVNNLNGPSLLVMGCPISYSSWDNQISGSIMTNSDNNFDLTHIQIRQLNGICCAYNCYSSSDVDYVGSHNKLYWRFLFVERYYWWGSNSQGSGGSCFRVCRVTDRIPIDCISGWDTTFRTIPSSQLTDICKCWHLSALWVAADHDTNGGEMVINHVNDRTPTSGSGTGTAGYYWAYAPGSPHCLGWSPNACRFCASGLESGAEVNYGDNCCIRETLLDSTFATNGRWHSNGTKSYKWCISADVSSEGGISTEHGGSAPHSMSEYYKGGGLVANTSANADVPTSGTIKMSDFFESD